MINHVQVCFFTRFFHLKISHWTYCIFNFFLYFPNGATCISRNSLIASNTFLLNPKMKNHVQVCFFTRFFSFENSSLDIVYFQLFLYFPNGATCMGRNSLTASNTFLLNSKHDKSRLGMFFYQVLFIWKFLIGHSVFSTFFYIFRMEQLVSVETP